MTRDSIFDFAVLELEIGVALIAFWLLSLALMWFLVDRRTRSGPIRNVGVIEGMMLLSILSLLVGGTLIIKGLSELS